MTSSNEAARIVEAMREQGKSDHWLVMRNARITRSIFGEILHWRESTNPRKLVEDLMGYGGSMTVLLPHICWGNENEEKAWKC